MELCVCDTQLVIFDPKISIFKAKASNSEAGSVSKLGFLAGMAFVRFVPCIFVKIKRFERNKKYELNSFRFIRFYQYHLTQKI